MCNNQDCLFCFFLCQCDAVAFFGGLHLCEVPLLCGDVCDRAEVFKQRKGQMCFFIILFGQVGHVANKKEPGQKEGSDRPGAII